MAGMRRLWRLRGLPNIELQAPYIRSAANRWTDSLSRRMDLGNWRLDSHWFESADTRWSPRTVDQLFASEISAQLRWYYYAVWHGPGSEGVDTLAYDRRKENNWVNKPRAILGMV
eukprot:gene18564-biopygen19153